MLEFFSQNKSLLINVSQDNVNDNDFWKLFLYYSYITLRDLVAKYRKIIKDIFKNLLNYTSCKKIERCV